MARLGNDPPLDPAPEAASAGRHAISIRWLGACVLIGVTGAVLLGSAIIVSSEGEMTFAELAQPAPTLAARSGEGRGMRKSDKLIRAETVASAKQVFRAPMTLRAGDREVIKVRSFTRIATGLSLTSGVHAVNIPTFNPTRFFSTSDGDRTVEPAAPETGDAEVSVVKTDLSTLMLEPTGPTLRDEDALAQLAAEARTAEEAGRRSALPLLPTPAYLPRAVGAGEPAGGLPQALFPQTVDTPFRSIEVRVVPENVTDLPKSAGRTGGLSFEDRPVPLRRGETLEAVLRTHGAEPDEARSILNALGARERGLDGMQVRLLLAPPANAGERRPIMRAILYGERGIEAIAAMNDKGAFVSVAPPPQEGGRTSQQAEEDEPEGTGARLYESLYETALKHDLSRQTVEDLVRIFGYDLDFQRRVAPGDSFEIFFATDEDGGERPEILSATLTVGSEVRRVFRFQNEDGTTDFLDEAGRSLRRFLLRKPLLDARLTSGFGSRYHPLLGYQKAHTGVDWANRIGTPIFAAGNGTIIKAGWDGGYGRRIEIQHTNGYVTTYSHQSAFARGIKPGVRVRQGQVIGYVGSTGLSTGPHLHYEVLVNGRFMDPMKIRVPRGRELDSRSLADFTRQRTQIQALAERAGAANQLAASDPR